MGHGIVYDHILAIVNTESRRFPAGSTVRILDAGCGNGLLMGWLRDQLPRLHPDLRFEVSGFDVCDYGTRREGSPPEGVSWISIEDPWPYPDNFFQVVISNHVLEHVATPDVFFSELQRTLCEGGFSAHLFPLRHCIWEGHIHLPFVHWIANRDMLRSYIKLMSRLHLGRFRAHSAALGVGLDQFAEQHADFILFFTRYMRSSDALRLARRHNLGASWRFTRDLYGRKLGSVSRRRPSYVYDSNRSALWDWATAMLLRYVSGVTLFVEKSNTYRHGTEQRVASLQKLVN